MRVSNSGLRDTDASARGGGSGTLGQVPCFELHSLLIAVLPRRSYNPRFGVRILILSDIHSNLEALEACLAAAPAHDLVINLGDVVGYGASPNEVIERSRTLGHIFVRGNHDKAASGAM